MTVVGRSRIILPKGNSTAGLWRREIKARLGPLVGQAEQWRPQIEWPMPSGLKNPYTWPTFLKAGSRNNCLDPNEDREICGRKFAHVLSQLAQHHEQRHLSSYGACHAQGTWRASHSLPIKGNKFSLRRYAQHNTLNPISEYFPPSSLTDLIIGVPSQTPMIRFGANEFFQCAAMELKKKINPGEAIATQPSWSKGVRN